MVIQRKKKQGCIKEKINKEISLIHMLNLIHMGYISTSITNPLAYSIENNFPHTLNANPNHPSFRYISSKMAFRICYSLE